MPTMSFDPNFMTNRAQLLRQGTAGLVGPTRLAAPVKLKEPDHDDQIARVASILGIDNEADWNRIAALQRTLEAYGINDAGALQRALVDSQRGANDFRMPPAPQSSMSQLFSDVEVLDTVSTDTIITNIATTLKGTTTTITLGQMPMKWYFTDITVDGDMLATGSAKLVEVRVLLGTRVITKFRLSQLSRGTKEGMVFDALQKIYQYEIGPSSTVKIEIENMNATVGDSFVNGYVQYTYQPVIDGNTAQIIRGR